MHRIDLAALAARLPERPLTRFEQRGLKLGYGVWDIVFRKPADSS